MKTIGLVLFAALLSTATLLTGLVSDDDPLKSILSRLERFRYEYPQEKVYLHLDKPYYVVGDTLWFKAYVVNGENNKLSGLSKILYVELINEKDSLKRSLRIPMEAGLAWGDFILGDTLREGNYRLRAYTRWMRNFGENFFFDKTIKIGNSYSNNILTQAEYSYSKAGSGQKVEANLTFTDLAGKPLAKKEVTYDVQLNFRNIAKGKGTTDNAGKIKISFVNTQPFILKSGKINTSVKLEDKKYVAKSFPVKATTSEADVQFFPESGQMVKNIRSKIAFKAVGADGLGVPVSGYVVDEKNEKIVDFNSEFGGMGSFVLTPLANAHYTAVVKFRDGSEKKIALPKAANDGYVLTVNNTDPENLLVKIAMSENILKKGGEISLIAQTKGALQYISKATLESPVFNAVIPKKRFPPGILHLTLFSAYQPVAERVVFIHSDDLLKIDIATNKQLYGKREKVKMDITVEDSSGNPAKGSFSLAVTDAGKLPFAAEDETTILSNLLLSSDLQGYIEKPNYYFTDFNNEKAKELDNLMLTQGWSRFIWKNILSDTYPPIAFMPERSIEISGRVTNIRGKGKPVVGGKVSLLSTDGDGVNLDTLTDADGRFSFSNLSFRDNTKFVVQARNKDGRQNVEIELFQTPPQLVTKSKNTAEIEVNVNSSILPYVKSSQSWFDELNKYGYAKKSIVLAEVKVVQKKPAVKYSSNLNGAGNADQVIRNEELQNCISLIQCLQGRIRGVIFSNGLPYSTRGGGPMGVMIDGVFTSASWLSAMNPRDVESIEVLRNAAYLAIYGLRGGNGIIMINTKRGERNLNPSLYARGILSYYPQGYYTPREFYSPKYETSEKAQFLDLRSTVFWEPNLITDEQGRASIEFYTTDVAGPFRIVIEGLDIKGKLGRKVAQYTAN